MKLCVIGLGQMGFSLVQGILNNRIFKGEDIIGCDKRLTELKEEIKPWRINTAADNKVGVKKAEVVLLAVKPQVMDDVLEEIADNIADKLIISIAAGITVKQIRSRVPESVRIVRAMPNTPALIKSGITALFFEKQIGKEEHDLVDKIFGSVGETIEIPEEMMNTVTGLSGSGPAYVYMMIEALTDAGVLQGLAREKALKLAAETVKGAAEMVLQTGRHPAQLKDMVTSPGGTTIAGLEVLENNNFRGTLIKTVKRAVERSQELGEE